MVEAALERYGGVHVLFNNVGILARGTVVDVKEEDWDRVLEVNLKSMMLTSKHAVPRMVEAGGGSIINVSSIAGLRAGSGGSAVPYSASKGGVIALTTTMAVEHGRDNIRVNCIAPGHIYTPMVAGNMTEETRDLRRRAGPLGTEGTAWDIAWAATFLASDESRWISGVVLPVDAGLLATTPMSMLGRLR
jgi:NAD(P)-dependent dehydrogenase (short-subunit alcohol dehydrogenase family)